jgi:hypothetical protein
MGSYSHLIISGYPILTQKNGYLYLVLEELTLDNERIWL